MAASSRRGSRSSSVLEFSNYALEALESRTLLSAGGRVRSVFLPAPADMLTNAPPQTPAAAPVITAVTPNDVIAGGPAFTLTVTGTSFASNSTILWNGNTLPTTVTTVGPSQYKLSATVPAANICNPSTAAITVQAAAVVSSSVPITIRRPDVVAYLPDYSFDGTFPKLDFSDVTQINYFEIVPSSTGMLPASSSQGYVFDSPTSQINKLVTAAHNASPRVAVEITLGPEAPFQLIANDATGNAQTTLVTQLTAFCAKYHLDGVDMDYEPDNALSTTDQNNYVALLTQLHTAMANAGLKLTAAVQAWQQIIPLANSNVIDRYYVMDYDLFNDSTAPYDDSITYLQNWMNYGIQPSKLLFGVPFYGRAIVNGTSTAETYSDIFDSYHAAHNAYPAAALDAVSAGGSTWGYNGIGTLQKKAAYALAHGLGGVMVWQIGQDHFDSNGKYDAYSLLPAIAADVLGVVHLTSSGSGNITLTQDADQAHVDWVSGNWTGTFPIGDLTGLQVISNGAADTIKLVQTAGNPLPNVLRVNGTFTLSGLSGSNPFAGKTLDINKSTVYLAYGTPANDPIANIRQNLQSGYAGGGWVAPTFQGVITSAAAAADSTKKSAIGYADSAAGSVVASLPANTIELKYTLYGDTGLTGTVGFTDFMRLTQHFTAASGSTWLQGDFNFDGAVNNADFLLLKPTYGSTLPAPVPEQTPIFNPSPITAITSIDAPGVSETNQIAPNTRKHKKQR